MDRKNIPLVEVDEAKITLIMDNSIDVFMPSSEIAQRLDLNLDLGVNRPSPIAEHGFSALIQVRCGDKEGKVIMDAGISSSGVLHNIDSLGLNLDSVQAIIISHGHSDHTLGLPRLIERLEARHFTLIMHPDALLERKVVMPSGYEFVISPTKIDLLPDHITFIETKDPTLLSDNMILVSGEIERTTDFEKGFLIHYTKRKGSWEHDPLIKDDQCVILNVRGKGLVIITGCGHSGIINTIRYAQTLTNIKQVYAVLGGFHLTGGIFEKIIPATISELKKINPTYLMPGHCTGWSAIHQIANALPEAFIPNNVGTTLVFK